MKSSVDNASRITVLKSTVLMSSHYFGFNQIHLTSLGTRLRHLVGIYTTFHIMFLIRVPNEVKLMTPRLKTQMTMSWVIFICLGDCFDKKVTKSVETQKFRYQCINHFILQIIWEKMDL